MILSLDMASKCGWAILDNDKLFKYGFFDFRSVKDTDIRIHKLKKSIDNLIATYEIDKVYIEDIQYQSRIITYKVLSKIQGVILNLLIELGIEYELVHCKTWKSKCGVKKKTDSIDIVKEKFGIEVDNDVADAICLGLSKG